MNVTLEVLWALGGVIFAAGSLVMLLRLLKRDVDGLGARVRTLDEKTKILLMTICSEQDRKWIAEMLLKK